VKSYAVMDTEQEYGVNLKMAVYVEGITSTDTDEQITKLCSAFGPVNKVIRVRQTGQENGVKALVEFKSEESVIVRKTHTKFYPTQHSSPTVTTKTRKQTTVTQSAQIHQGASDNDILNPPDVQRIIVEHVIKNDNFHASGQESKRLRPFSGKLPKPPNEADFQTWSLHVELMIQDKTPVDIQRRKILESLLPPASDLIRQLGPDAAPRNYVKLLDSAYGLIEDGEEIFARFLSTHQNTGEKASEYLQRLQVLITTAIKRGGIAKADANKQLLRQFWRGCWDQSLILALQLGLKTENPPDFTDFLLQVRTEEDQRAAKQDRMQRHLGTHFPHSRSFRHRRCWRSGSTLSRLHPSQHRLSREYHGKTCKDSHPCTCCA
uniref:RRM domain-containing protein n=1 Tax=Sander lucioperca TaxID=283035 RepID=A0A8C9ZYY6_SANLU